MVIAPSKGGVGPFVILADGEFLPEKFNTEKVVVMRRGDSTNREVKVIKEFGHLADPELLKPPALPVCNYTGDGNPLHEHEDKTWWFYEETWQFEQGPFETYGDGYDALYVYCVALDAQRTEAEETANKDLTTNSESASVELDELPNAPEE